jgi:hypothetical protein
VNFKIEVEGLNDVFKSLTDLESGESKTSFIAWTNRVELLAKQFCGDEKSHRIELKHTVEMGVDFEFEDKHAIDCVLKAIEQLKDSMPAFLKGFYERVVDNLTTKRIALT